MKFNIEIDVDEKSDFIMISTEVGKVGASVSVWSKLAKIGAKHAPKGIDLFFAASSGIIDILGPARYFGAVASVLGQQLSAIFSNLRRKQNAGTDRGTTEAHGQVFKGKVSSPGLGQKGT